MADFRPIIDFPGIVGPKQGTYTLTRGITPGIVTIVCDPELGNLQGTGTVTLGDGRSTVSIPKCQVDQINLEFNINQQLATIPLLDRRWMWQFGSIDGRYNVTAPRVYDVPAINASGTQTGNPTSPDDADTAPSIQEDTKKSARELATLLFEAMGETGYDVGALPHDDFPAKEWDATNPARELESLANQYGCVVCYSPFTDKAGIVKDGVGAELPQPGVSDLQSDALSIDPPEGPRAIVVYGAPVEHQVRFQLEAVGLDFDGRVKLLDDLSYKPSGGWGSMSPPFSAKYTDAVFPNLPTGRHSRDAVALIQASVYRWYRIKHTLPMYREGECWIPVDDTESATNRKRLDHIVLLPYRIETAQDDLGQRNKLGATCYGITKGGSANFRSTVAGDEVKASFSIDAARQLVIFNERQYRIDATTKTPVAADLILECAVNIMDNDNHQVVRSRFEFPLNQQPSSDRPRKDELAIVRDDIRQFFRTEYIDAISNQVNVTASNETACRDQAKYYAESEAVKFQTNTPQVRIYNEIRPIQCDGAIQSVSWTAGLGGISTQASRGTELQAVSIPYRQRRKWEEISLESLSRSRDADVQRKRDIKRAGGDFDPFAV